MKAKHKHALQEHGSLVEELRVARAEQNYWYEKKEALLDEFLTASFGYGCLSLMQIFSDDFSRDQAEPLLRSHQSSTTDTIVLSD
jgi:hypothetical protein